MSWEAVGRSLDHALALPRKPRSNAIDHGQLRLLFRIAVLNFVGRSELDRRDQDDMSAINKRLAYLQSHALIKVDQRYWGNAPRWRFSLTDKGQKLIRHLSRGRNRTEMLSGLDHVRSLVGREQFNVSHLKTLVFMAQSDTVCVPDLIEYLNDNRQTLRSRLKRLREWQLISREERFNAGGHTHFNHWRLTAEGRAVVTALYPEGFTDVSLPNSRTTHNATFSKSTSINPRKKSPRRERNR